MCWGPGSEQHRWPVVRGCGLLVREEGQRARVVPGNCREGKGNEKQEAGEGSGRFYTKNWRMQEDPGGRGASAESRASRELMAAGAQCGWRVRARTTTLACPLEVLNLKCLLLRSLSKFKFLVSEWKSVWI